MKNKIKNIILFLLMFILIIAIVTFAIAIYLDIMDTEESPDKVYTVNMIKSDTKDVRNENAKDTQIETSDNMLNIAFFYNQLTNTQKKLYDGLKENKENMMNGTYQIEYGNIFSDIINEESGKEKLGDDYQSAVEAFLYDNPDVFYIDANKLYLTVETSNRLFKKTNNVYIGPKDNSNYYVDGFESEQQVKSAMKKIQASRDEVLRNLTDNTYRNVLKIHDYLIDTIDYDQNYSSIGSYSVYGALVDKKCVCEGYAKALKYLLNAADIPCIIVQGTAINSTGKSESHAWNCVYVNDEWYYIDATWNDPIIIGKGTIAKSIQYKYFLKGSKTMSKDHTLVYKFSDRGKTFWYPKVSEKDYK